MNFLAHISLSGQDAEVIMGNFCGDYIKGKLDSAQKQNFPENFLKGVRLHRFIDNFTDTDHTVKLMVKELRQYYGRAAPIAVDISFDHFLARNYKHFHPTGLREFVSRFYVTMSNFEHLIPASMKPLAEALRENDWLFKYQEWDTVKRTFRSMGRRYEFLQGFATPSCPTTQELTRFEGCFNEFYPRLQCASIAYLEELNTLDGGDQIILSKNINKEI